MYFLVIFKDAVQGFLQNQEVWGGLLEKKIGGGGGVKMRTMKCVHLFLGVGGVNTFWSEGSSPNRASRKPCTLYANGFSSFCHAMLYFVLLRLLSGESRVGRSTPPPPPPLVQGPKNKKTTILYMV